MAKKNNKKIIHTGKLPGDSNTDLKEYFSLLNLVERIVLKILDYDGYYIDCLDLRKNLNNTIDF